MLRGIMATRVDRLVSHTALACRHNKERQYAPTRGHTVAVGQQHFWECQAGEVTGHCDM